MNIDEEIKILKKNRLLETNEEIINFEESIENILSMENITHIKYLLLGFDDNTKNPEVMFGLIHAIESYDNIVGTTESLNELAKNIIILKEDAMKWAIILHKRILNHKISLELYSSIVKFKSPDIKNYIINVMHFISDDNPKNFKDKVDLFLKLLEQ